MDPTITVALITGFCAVVSNYIISRSQSKKDDNKRLEEKQALETAEAVRAQQLQDRLLSIESKLDEHNGYAEKFVQQGDRLEAIEKTQIAIQKDIEYLKKGA